MLACAPGWALFFSLLFVPTAYKPAKYVLIVLVLLIIGANIAVSGRIQLHPTVLAWTYVFVSSGAAFVLLGLAQNAPGAVPLAPLYVAWPIAYIIFVAGAAEPRVLSSLEAVLVFGAFAIFGYALIFIFVQAGLLPSFLLLPLNLDENIGFYSGFIQFTLNNLASMLFLVPYLMARVVIRPSEESRAGQLLLWSGLILGVAAVSLSLRRGIMLAVGLSPLFIAVLVAFLPRRERVRAARSLAGLVAALVILMGGAVLFAHYRYGWTPDNMLAFISGGFDFQSPIDPGALARSLQFSALIDSWSSSPIFGAGAGAAGATYVRDPAQPWAYELSYVALLYQTGVVGVALYASGIIWIFWTGIRMIRSGHPLGLRLFPVLTGVAAFLVGNATNPYLAKFDYLWVIFLPVAYINLWLLRSRTEASPDREPTRFSPSKSRAARPPLSISSPQR